MFVYVKLNPYLCIVGGCDIRDGFGEMFFAEGGLQSALLFLKVGTCWSLLGPHLYQTVTE